MVFSCVDKDVVSFTSIVPQTQQQASIGQPGYITGNFVNTGDTIVVRFYNGDYGTFDATGYFASSNSSDAIDTTQINYKTIPLYSFFYHELLYLLVVTDQEAIQYGM